MDCSQILPGAINPGPCSVATGYLDNFPFICYASGTNLVILDGKLRHLQTILGSNFGYNDTRITCMFAAELSGKIVGAWGFDVVVFKPEHSDVTPNEKFNWSWKQCYTQTYPSKVSSLSFNRNGTQLLVGGDFISLCTLEYEKSHSSPEKIERGEEEREAQWREAWSMNMSSHIRHLKYSPDGTMFASAAVNDRLVKIWYQTPTPTCKDKSKSTQRSKVSSPTNKYSFTYIAHPRAITGLDWRKTSVHMRKGAVPNVLLTRCKDNTCRLWTHSLQKEKAPQSNLLRFFLASTIDPIADIPFRSTMPVEDAAFIVHWLNNKEMTFSSKVDYFHRVLTRNPSLTSLSSTTNEEILSSWVCVEEKGTPDPDGTNEYQSYSLGDYLQPPSPHHSRPSSATLVRESGTTLNKKKESQLMEEWVNSPDLLVCIHPNNGSLLVWTVEGLDSPKHSTRLVHISFSSCLPHVFAPHLAQTLHQELQQYLLKETEDRVLPHTPSPQVPSHMSLSTSELSLPVPQIRLPVGKKNVIDIPESSRTLRPDASLILLSSHCNGSLNAWSVELTVQANYCTSIAGLIHCGETGGHSKEVCAVYRHPWLPVLMTVANQEIRSCMENELIIWNANLAGPLDHKSQVRELSRITSPETNSFKVATWVPPIALADSNVGALSRCPSFGLFVTNVGNELCLFQTSLYPIIPPNSSHTHYHNSCPLYEDSSKDITISSHSGNHGMGFIGLIENDLDTYDEIIDLHAFRMSSAVLEMDSSDSFLSVDLSDEVLVVLIENQKIESSGRDSPSFSSGYRSYLHVWRVILQEKEVTPRIKRTNSLDPWYQLSSPSTLLCYATIKKVFSEPFPLSNINSYVVHSNPSCDIASSLQLQLPSLSSPYLFTTVCSDGEVHCWQFKVNLLKSEISFTIDEEVTLKQQLKLEPYDVFGSGSTSSHKGPIKVLNCVTNPTLKELPLSSYIPCAFSSAYPGRFAMAHHLTKPLKSAISSNPLDKHVMVSIWECESSGGLQWVCESVLPLHGLGGMAVGSRSHVQLVHMDWLPMENGAYLLATCFNSVISIFGMALPIPETQLTQPSKDIFSRRFSKSISMPIMSSVQASSSWACILKFPCARPLTGLSTHWLAYTGSNSIMLAMGCEIQIYSCWVNKEKLHALSQHKISTKIRSKSPKKHSRLAPRLAHTDCVNLLDYAHSKNSPLPQYHPKILTDLLNAGKLEAVKLIMVNLVKYLLLYQEKSNPGFKSFDEIMEEEREESDSRMRLLSMADGTVKRSRNALVKVEVENIPPVSLSQLKIFSISSSEEEEAKGDDREGEKEDEDTDYDALFSQDVSSSYDKEFTLDEDQIDDAISFDTISLFETKFDPDLADKMTSILCYARLPDLNDIEQVRLLAIAQAVARTKMSFSELPVYSTSIGIEAPDLATSMGAGYAAVGFVPGGLGGGEAMDDCGLRYILALQSFITLSVSLPKDVVTEGLAPSDIIWAFHSDAETELLSNIPCVQEDRLEWLELKNAGVGWWIRSSDTLRKLIEKLAKTQFMMEKDPMNACLFYIAMKKQSLVKGLFKTVNDDRMMKFFANDFTEERWRKAALKNAFALLSKQRFEHAAAFFLLAGKLWDAVEVCTNRMRDIQLALVITRLFEGDGGPIYERLLKENVLGITPRGSMQQEPSPDPFLRSMGLWLLQDYSGSLETLLVGLKHSSDQSQPPNTAIFNFYFYLRSHPLLIRRKYPVKKGHSIQPSQSVTNFSSQYHGQSLSGVGDDPLTPTERNLVFSTAYHHLNSGSPLLALTVLSKLPKLEDLGLTDEPQLPPTALDRYQYRTQRTASFDAIMSGLIKGGSLVDNKNSDGEELDWSQPVSFQVGASQQGTIELDRSLSGSNQLGAIKEESEFDWSKPVTTQIPSTVEEDEFDWSKPVSSQLGLDEDEFDWSKPVSSQVVDSDEMEEEDEEKEEQVSDINKVEDDKSNLKKCISSRGLFILSLAEQLQYNALLSLLTEELATIHLQACCDYLWMSRGKEALPLLPLANVETGGSKTQSMVEWFEDEAFARVLTTLQGKLVDWLRSEMMIVKEVCGMEISAGTSQTLVSTRQAAHAGYDVLTTLLNYTTLHAGTLPSMLAVKTELMHLTNTLLPWSTGLSQELEDADMETGQIATCAINPAQLPLLTACSLPCKHPLNLALHLRLLSASIFNSLSSQSSPPTSSNPLQHVDRVFELCTALSHCISLCLSPMRLHQDIATGEPMTQPGSTPNMSGRQRTGSGSALLDFFSIFDTPNTRPSKWPGLRDWPASLLSDDGKDASPLCLVLMEALMVVYTGLLVVAWSKHSIYDLLILVANVPSQDKWAALFGGGVFTKLPEKKSASFKQRVSSMKKMLKQSVHEKKESELGGDVGLFVAPKKSLLDHCLSKPQQTDTSSIIHFEKEVDDDDTDDDDGDDELWHSETYEFESDGENPSDPDNYSWCLMNLGIVKFVQRVLRSTISLTGMEVLEFITASPVLYKLLMLLEDWETSFTHQLETHTSTPPNLFPNDREQPGYGPALTRHKFILEAEHSPFRDDNKASRLARRLWSCLVHQEYVREIFIKYIFHHKRLGATVDEPPVQRIVYRQPDSPVSSICINSGNSSVFALATSREVLEIEVPDILSLDIMPYGEESSSEPQHFTSKRTSLRSDRTNEDFIMIGNGSSFRRSSHVVGMYSQTGSTSSILLKRSVSSVKRMASHPTLAYYLTGSADGSLRMFEFGTPKPVSVLRQPGSGPGITRIRFTPQGNKYGVTDVSGKLCLWQGIQTYPKDAYQTLNPSNTRCTISDFAFLGSSSLIVTCGDSVDNKNISIWDTLMPSRNNIVKEFICHEGGASAIAFSSNEQRLISGGRRGEISIFDMRQHRIVSNLTVHSAAVTRIVLNDTEGYFITGSQDGEIKVWDLFTVSELTSIAGRHSKTRLFRPEGGVMDMIVDPDGCLYSCGADGTVKVHTLDLPYIAT